MDFYRAVLTGKAGMWMGMLSEHREVLEIVKADVRWGVVPLPRDARSVTGVTVDGYVISAEAQNLEECWKWLVFLSSHVPRNLIPARESVAESKAYEQRVGKDLARVARLCMEDAVLISPNVVGFEKALDAFQAAVEEVINRRLTAEEAMDWAQRQAEQQAW
jgi:ABC-type glycerol-3-phosphate transport system substrate-binding protein